MIKKIALGIIGLLIVIQFIPQEKNLSDDQLFDISKKYEIPADVQDILKNACNDCHTNKSTYPWYSHIQPVGFWLNHHINDGKRHLNFDEFLTYDAKKKDHKMEELIESQTEGWMPMESYTLIHKEAKLTSEEKNAIIAYAKSVRAMVGYTKVGGEEKGKKEEH